MLLGALSTGGSLPFWAVSNQWGIMPENSGVLAVVAERIPFDESKTFQWREGVSLAANWQPVAPLDPGSSPLKGYIDEAYLGGRWKSLRLDAGIWHREPEFLGADPSLGSLSVTSGHLVEAGNACAMPGVQLTLEPWKIPFTKGHLLLEGAWGDFWTLDQRYVQGAMAHRVRAYLTFDSGGGFFIRAGLDHYALWGGVSPTLGPMPSTFGDYLRVCVGKGASSSGSRSDRVNVLGDHGGAEQLRLGWRGGGHAVTFQYEKPYADKSGMRFNNIPDGVYTLQWSRESKDCWVSDALLEFHYTMWQSGTLHESETDESGKIIPWHPGLNIFGGDNYFNNGEYRSGWTHFGRSIAGPLFFTGPDKNGVVNILNNRYKAIHAGLSGKLFRKAPYRLMLTASWDYGTYFQPYTGKSSWGSGWNWWEPETLDTPLFQFSAGLSGFVPFALGRCSLDVVYGMFADVGELLPRNFAATLGVRLIL